MYEFMIQSKATVKIRGIIVIVYQIRRLGRMHERSRLREMAEAEIAHGGGRRFPELLRFRYEADREGPRLQELHKLTKLAVFMYTACALLIHMLLYARFSVPVLICQILVVVPLLVLLNWRLVRPGLPGFWREAGVVVVSFAAVLGVIVEAALSPSGDVIMIMFMAVSPMLGCMFFARIPPVPALIYLGLCVFSVYVALLARPDVPADFRFYPLGSMIAVGAFALFGLRELDIAGRRVYLMGLLQTLRIEDLAEENDSLSRISATDPLTGVGNRRLYESELSALNASSEGVFLLLIDLDYFKELNDRYGHSAGDDCLRHVANLLSSPTRIGDVRTRIGGDEFAVILKNATLLDAWREAERICAAVAHSQLQHEGRRIRVSVSIGGAGWSGSLDSRRFAALADAALYESKRGGRGRVAWARNDDNHALEAPFADDADSAAA